MTQKFAFFLFGCAALWLTLFSCTKPSPFGANLLQSEIAEFDTLSLPVICTVEQEDKLVTSDRKAEFDYFLCGKVVDPIFGTVSSDIYTQILPASSPVNFANTTLDSIVMILPYASAGVYGDTTQAQNLRVVRLRDTFESRNYYATEQLAEEVEVGRVNNFLPHPTALYKGLDTASSVAKFAHIRIRLDDSYGEYLRSVDSLTMTNEQTYIRATKGLKITTSSNAAPGAMLAFDLNSSLSRIRIYYKIGTDTVQKKFDLTSSQLVAHKFTHFEVPRIGTMASESVGKALPPFVYLQGMGNTRLKVEFPSAPDLDDIIVNNAILEFSATRLTEDNTTLPFATQLVMSERVTDSTFLYISDIRYSLSIRQNFAYFGGAPLKETGDIYRYRMSVTQHFQDIVDDVSGDINKRTLYVTVNAPRFSAQRVVLHGSNATTAPALRAKLNLKYTKLK
jgi:Domain of unknown function (DUF4270)